MNPHVHAEEGMYVIDCANAYIRCGSSADTLGERELIKPGMIILCQKASGMYSSLKMVDFRYCLLPTGWFY